jgi:hypothetical protein
VKDGGAPGGERRDSNHLGISPKKQQHRALRPDAPPLLDRRFLVVDARERGGVGEEQKVAAHRRQAVFEGAGALTHLSLERESGAFDRPSTGYGNAPQPGGARRHDRGERREGKPAGPGA